MIFLAQSTRLFSFSDVIFKAVFVISHPVALTGTSSGIAINQCYVTESSGVEHISGLADGRRKRKRGRDGMILIRICLR